MSGFIELHPLPSTLEQAAVIYVAVETIGALIEKPGRFTTVSTSQDRFNVTETPAEIMALIAESEFGTKSTDARLALAMLLSEFSDALNSGKPVGHTVAGFKRAMEAVRIAEEDLS